GQLLLEPVERLEIRARRMPGEDPALELLELDLQRVLDREVAVDDRVDERIEDEARPMAQKLGLVFGPRAYRGESLLRPLAHREDVVRPHEDVDLPLVQLAVAHLD